MLHFHSWSRWNDILTFNWSYSSYVLQGGKCNKCDKIEFNNCGTDKCVTMKETDLVKAKLWKN